MSSKSSKRNKLKNYIDIALQGVDMELVLDTNTRLFYQNSSKNKTLLITDDNFGLKEIIIVYTWEHGRAEIEIEREKFRRFFKSCVEFFFRKKIKRLI